jgi:hypothetical protein
VGDGPAQYQKLLLRRASDARALGGVAHRPGNAGMIALLYKPGAESTGVDLGAVFAPAQPPKKSRAVGLNTKQRCDHEGSGGNGA